MSALALATRGLSMSFGSLVVARNIELNLPAGARYALIGPNGAGKTTLINLMTGMLAPNAGQILLGDEDITELEPQERVRRGLARTFQINTLFPSLNALEAVTLAVDERRGIAGAILEQSRRQQRIDRGGLRYPGEAAARRRLLSADARIALWASTVIGDRAGAGEQAEGAAAR